MLLEGLSGAYRLRLDAAGGGTDVARARALLATAGADPADARRLLAEARSLWRGVALAEFDDVGLLAALAVTLHAARQCRAGLRHRRHRRRCGRRSRRGRLTLVAADPLSEAAVLILMRALDAAGRAADALRAGRPSSPPSHRDRPRTLTRPQRARANHRRRGHGCGRPHCRGERPAGRDAEVAAVQRLLTHQRLVTVLGAGGVGKTALAAEIAARADHVTVVALAPITDPAAIPQARCGARPARRARRRPVGLRCAARRRPQLLVLDNCEHLLPGVRDLVATLATAVHSSRSWPPVGSRSDTPPNSRCDSRRWR